MEGSSMNFNEFTTWVKKHGIDFTLKAMGGCMVDLISFNENKHILKSLNENNYIR
jgi:hypothetical protein